MLPSHAESCGGSLAAITHPQLLLRRLVAVEVDAPRAIVTKAITEPIRHSGLVHTLHHAVVVPETTSIGETFGTDSDGAAIGVAALPKGVPVEMDGIMVVG